MPSNVEPMSQAQKLKALRKVQYMLGQQQQPVARACGLTEEELPTLANEELIEVVFFSDDGPDLDRYSVVQILPKGYALLSHEHVSDAPFRVAVESQKRSLWQRIYPMMGKILWELFKAALTAGTGLFVGWLLWKKHWK